MAKDPLAEFASEFLFKKMVEEMKKRKAAKAAKDKKVQKKVSKKKPADKDKPARKPRKKRGAVTPDDPEPVHEEEDHHQDIIQGGQEVNLDDALAEVLNSGAA